jgi:histone deacetylase 6
VQVIEPLIAEFSPDLVLVSAGFDAAEGDYLGGMNLSPAGIRIFQKVVKV